jgi:pimeloyl-ACP methyl ester carboxylesterase
MEAAVLQREPVDVGDVVLETVVMGAGSPTVVFVNGLGAPLEEWALVAPAIAERHQVVCYDRRCAPAKGHVPTHDAAQICADLHRLLDTLGVTGPLVLVGHSWGGAVVRRYALEHPGAVAGLVLVDASHENIKAMREPTRATRVLYTLSTFTLRFGPLRRRLVRGLGFDRLPKDALASVDALPWMASGRTSLAEYAGIGSSLTELAREAPDLPPVPTRVLLAAGRPGLTTKLAARQIAKIRAIWEEAVAGRNDVTLEVVADAGHYISLDQPQAVIDAIEDVSSQVGAARR